MADRITDNPAGRNAEMGASTDVISWGAHTHGAEIAPTESGAEADIARELVEIGEEMLFAFAEGVEWSAEQREAYTRFHSVVSKAKGLHRIAREAPVADRITDNPTGRTTGMGASVDPAFAREIQRRARILARHWQKSAFTIHKRPPFRAHPFDTQDRYWVVGSTCISVLGGWFGSEALAAEIAAALNAAFDYSPNADNVA